MLTPMIGSTAKAARRRAAGRGGLVRKLVMVGVLALVSAMPATVTASASSPSGVSSDPAGGHAPACLPSAAPGIAHCGAVQLLDAATNWHGSHGPGASPGKGPGKKPGPAPGGGGTTPSGYYPVDLQSAYGLTSAISAFASSGAAQTVALVDAYDDPNAATDLATYRSYFGLPACTSANGCFTKVDQTGATSYPSASTSWSEEISLDLDMVSATCPGCHILLVEASWNSLGDPGAAEDYAAAHANAVSNSYGASELSGEAAYDVYYDHRGVAITAAAGDGGYGVEHPAASPVVTAVGGTTLTRDASSTRGRSETVWSGTGSGCSAYEANPGWQPTASLCTTRTVADAAADADPNTGVAVYDSFGEPGWLVFGGTSVASPIIASVYALADNASSFTVSSSGSDAAEGLYGASLNHVTSGANARHCDVYLCNAGDSLSGGYNGPTGDGTPNGTGGLQARWITGALPSRSAGSLSQMRHPLGVVRSDAPVTLRQRRGRGRLRAADLPADVRVADRRELGDQRGTEEDQAQRYLVEPAQLAATCGEGKHEQRQSCQDQGNQVHARSPQPQTSGR